MGAKYKGSVSGDNNIKINNPSDKIWTCNCGAWNAYYRNKCGACDGEKK